MCYKWKKKLSALSKHLSFQNQLLFIKVKTKLCFSLNLNKPNLGNFAIFFYL